TLMGGKSGQWFTANIYSQFITRFNWELGSAFGFVLLLTSSMIVWLVLRLAGQSLSGTLGRGGRTMLASIPQSKLLRAAYNAYVALFFLYLAAPLIVVAVFAFNDSLFPSLPWRGFTLDWFFNPTEPKLGLFHDGRIMAGFANSLIV